MAMIIKKKVGESVMEYCPKRQNNKKKVETKKLYHTKKKSLQFFTLDVNKINCIRHLDTTLILYYNILKIKSKGITNTKTCDYSLVHITIPN